MHVLKCAQMFSCAASKLAAGLNKQLLEAAPLRETVLGRRASPSEESSRIKQMIKQTSHWPGSLPSQILPGPHPCVSNKVTFEREQRGERADEGRRRQGGMVGWREGGRENREVEAEPSG